jgi:phage major head subunit gpT-like protein
MPPTGIIDRSLIEDALQGFQFVFDKAFASAVSQETVAALAMTVPSNSPSETYAWLGALPKMREWIGDRRMDEIRAYAQTIDNKDWSVGLRIAANDLSDDKLMMVSLRIQALAAQAAQHQEELLVEYLVNGFGSTKGLAYDGQFFFDTDHSDGGSAAQSNKGTTALDATTYAAAWQSMLERKDEHGEPIAVTPTTLIVGPKLRAVARTILEAEVLSSGATNVESGTAKLIVNRRLTGTYDDYWFLVGEQGPLRPLILQQREPVQFIAQDDPASEGYFNRKEFRYGAQWRGNAGYGLWQLAYGAQVA